MSKPSIYLAGPITGLSYKESTQWRNDFKNAVYPQIECFSPMRFKSYLSSEKVILDAYDQVTYSPLSTQRGVMTRDFFDCTRADIVVMNLLNTTKPSLGTVMEAAWTYQARIPLVAIMEKEGNPHDHGLIREAIGFRVETIEEAINVVKAILLP